MLTFLTAHGETLLRCLLESEKEYTIRPGDISEGAGMHRVYFIDRQLPNGDTATIHPEGHDKSWFTSPIDAQNYLREHVIRTAIPNACAEHPPLAELLIAALPVSAPALSEDATAKVPDAAPAASSLPPLLCDVAFCDLQLADRIRRRMDGLQGFIVGIGAETPMGAVIDCSNHGSYSADLRQALAAATGPDECVVLENIVSTRHRGKIITVMWEDEGVSVEHMDCDALEWLGHSPKAVTPPGDGYSVLSRGLDRLQPFDVLYDPVRKERVCLVTMYLQLPAMSQVGDAWVSDGTPVFHYEAYMLLGTHALIAPKRHIRYEQAEMARLQWLNGADETRKMSYPLSYQREIPVVNDVRAHLMKSATAAGGIYCGDMHVSQFRLADSVRFPELNCTGTIVGMRQGHPPLALVHHEAQRFTQLIPVNANTQWLRAAWDEYFVESSDALSANNECLYSGGIVQGYYPLCMVSWSQLAFNQPIYELLPTGIVKEIGRIKELSLGAYGPDPFVVSDPRNWHMVIARDGKDLILTATQTGRYMVQWVKPVLKEAATSGEETMA